MSYQGDNTQICKHMQNFKKVIFVGGEVMVKEAVTDDGIRKGFMQKVTFPVSPGYYRQLGDTMENAGPEISKT